MPVQDAPAVPAGRQRYFPDRLLKGSAGILPAPAVASSRGDAAGPDRCQGGRL